MRLGHTRAGIRGCHCSRSRDRKPIRKRPVQQVTSPHNLRERTPSKRKARNSDEPERSTEIMMCEKRGGPRAGAKKGKEAGKHETNSDKRAKASEKTHACSTSLWKVRKQAGLKSKLPGPGGSASTRGGWPSGAQGQSRFKE
jgi:hypothetical protein